MKIVKILFFIDLNIFIVSNIIILFLKSGTSKWLFFEVDVKPQRSLK